MGPTTCVAVMEHHTPVFWSWRCTSNSV